MHKLAIFSFMLLVSINLKAKEYHVAKNGNDTHEGWVRRPFRTISFAAHLAKPGDTITVHAGTYREWVSPEFGGTSNINRILYRAAPGERVVIKGSEVIKNWEKHGGNVWKVTIPNSFFGDYNPYKDSLYGDWFYPLGRIHHTGEVYLNGKSLYEVETLQKVEKPEYLDRTKDREGSLLTWYCTSDTSTTTIWANFKGKNPSVELVEINVRPTCFTPKQTRIDYITVRGFEMSQAATPFSPPTSEQKGLISPNWSKGWIVEDNIITDSKCVGICLGKERTTGHNFATVKKMKPGFQYEIEAIFKAIQIGWNKDNIGSHIVRRNTIFNCEQAGIVGHLGCAFSQIYDNHIYNISTKRQFNGAEMAGIKFHAPIDVRIEHNRIHDCQLGIWLDWQAQGTRVTRNLIYNNDKDLMIEVCLGPFLVDNNILLSPFGLDLLSEGGAYAHNLIVGSISLRTVPNRATPYHFPHSTAIMGTAVISGGDDRYFNNVFANKKVKQAVSASKNKAENMEATGSEKLVGDYGLAGYNVYTSSLNEYFQQLDKAGKEFGQGTVRSFEAVKQPVYMQSNLYYNEGKPYRRETGSKVVSDFDPCIDIEENESGVFLKVTLDESISTIKSVPVSTNLLGMTRISDAAFENPDGTPLVIDTDFLGNKRSTDSPVVGPFGNFTSGQKRIKVW